MILLDYKKLWDDGGYSKDGPYNRSMAHINKVADREELHRDIRDAVIGEFFLGLSAGQKYPLDHCPCGCGIDKSGTAITHALAKRIMVAGDKMREARGVFIQNAINKKIEAHIKRENYVKAKPKKSNGRGKFITILLAILTFGILK